MKSLVDQIVRFKGTKGRWLVVCDHGFLIGAQRIVKNGIPHHTGIQLNEQYRSFSREEIV